MLVRCYVQFKKKGNLCFDGPICEIYGFWFMKYEKQLLMWKVICVSCTLSWLAFLCQDCPSRYPSQHYSQVMRARAEIEPVKNTTTLLMSYIWDFPYLSFDTHFSHHSSLHHRGEAKNLYIFQQFLSFHFRSF